MIKTLLHTGLIILFLISAGNINGQNYKLIISSRDSSEFNFQYNSKHQNQESIKAEIDRVNGILHASGYLFSYPDTLYRIDSATYLQFFYIGSPLYIKDIRFTEENLQWLIISGLNRRLPRKTFYCKDELAEFYHHILIYLENRGHPFARISLKNIDLENDSLIADFNLDKGDFISIDSIVNSGNAQISESYLRRLYGISAGDPYNEALISDIDRKNSNIEFSQQSRPAEVEFYGDKARIRVFLDKKNASRFDGVAGFMPNQETGQKMLLTGDVNVRLVNSFSYAEQLELSWRRMGISTSDLRMRTMLPYAFGTAFSPEYKLVIFKKDTSWINVEHHLGIRYMINPEYYVKIYSEWFNSNIISTAGLESVTTLPQHADMKTNSLGMEVFFQKYNNINNPVRGYLLMCDIAAAKKTIPLNNNINPEAYKGVELKSSQYRIKWRAQKFTPIGKRSTFLSSISGGLMQGKNYFANEMFRLGGLKSLRGFDEESLIATNYGLLLLEYRFLLDENSFLGVFYNIAYTEDKTSQQIVIDKPMGLGAGISFETNAGIFSIYYAIGKQHDNPFDGKSAKIHFGFINTF